MAWPSKNPEDYAERGQWDDHPPRWLARLRGKHDPDPIPYALQIGVSTTGFVLGGGTAELLGWDALLVAGWSAAVARGLLQVVWRRRRSVAAVSPR